MNKQAMFTSISEEWRTPKELFDELNKEFHFDLDAAADHDNHLVNIAYFTKQNDALNSDWHKFGKRVWCNPPYGRNIGEWVRKGYFEALLKRCTVVMLIPARTDTKWFHDYCLPAAEIRFIKGRLKFADKNGEVKGRAPFPSMIVIFRPLNWW